MATIQLILCIGSGVNVAFMLMTGMHARKAYQAGDISNSLTFAAFGIGNMGFAIALARMAL